MTPGCVAEPVSWLRLERYALGELPAAAAREVAAHLARCPACAACLAQLEADVVSLPALPAPARPAVAPTVARPWWATWWSRLFVGGGLIAAAAAVLLFVVVDRSGRDGAASEATALDARPAGPRVAIKGAGAAALFVDVAVVRERAGAVEIEAARVDDGDRLKVRVTCPPAATGQPLHADVVVFQRGAGARLEAAFPLPARTIACGNQVTLDGAFRITPSSTGDRGATVCLALDPAAPIDRAALLRRGPRGPGLGCVVLAAE